MRKSSHFFPNAELLTECIWPFCTISVDWLPCSVAHLCQGWDAFCSYKAPCYFSLLPRSVFSLSHQFLHLLIQELSVISKNSSSCYVWFLLITAFNEMCFVAKLEQLWQCLLGITCCYAVWTCEYRIFFFSIMTQVYKLLYFRAK